MAFRLAIPAARGKKPAMEQGECYPLSVCLSIWVVFKLHAGPGDVAEICEIHLTENAVARLCESSDSEHAV